MDDLAGFLHTCAESHVAAAKLGHSIIIGRLHFAAADAVERRALQRDQWQAVSTGAAGAGVAVLYPDAMMIPAARVAAAVATYQPSPCPPHHRRGLLRAGIARGMTVSATSSTAIVGSLHIVCRTRSVAPWQWGPGVDRNAFTTVPTDDGWGMVLALAALARPHTPWLVVSTGNHPLAWGRWYAVPRARAVLMTPLPTVHTVADSQAEAQAIADDLNSGRRPCLAVSVEDTPDPAEMEMIERACLCCGEMRLMRRLSPVCEACVAANSRIYMED